MAQLLYGRGTTIEEPATTVAGMLGEGYVILAGALPRGQSIDMLVLGSRGIYALHTCAWAGEIRPSPNASWRVRLASGEVRSCENPRRRIQALDDALRAFLRDEVPQLRLPVYHFLVLTDPQAQPLPGPNPRLRMARPADLPTQIAALEYRQPDIADLSQLQALALALGDGHLTRRQRAWQPYTCSSSGTFGPAHYWTIDQVLRHLDRYPEEAVEHLLDGSLERWLREQGSPRLAGLAREAIRNAALAPRAAVEEFLISTGYMERPHLSMRPHKLDLGYLVAGDTATAWLQVRRGRGRGHLHGLVTPESSYLAVEPDAFSDATELRVTVATATLSLDEPYHEARLELSSNAQLEPIYVPVTFTLRPDPLKGVQRARLALGALLGGLIGLVLGWVVARWGQPFSSGGMGQPAMAAWLVLLGGYGTLVGLLRGWRQNIAWPLGHAALRWLGRIALRSLLWVGAALALLGLLSWFYPSLPRLISGGFVVTIMALLAAASLIPATVDQLRAEGQIAGRSHIADPLAPSFHSRPNTLRPDGQPLHLRQGEGNL